MKFSNQFILLFPVFFLFTCRDKTEVTQMSEPAIIGDDGDESPIVTVETPVPLEVTPTPEVVPAEANSAPPEESVTGDPAINGEPANDGVVDEIPVTFPLWDEKGSIVDTINGGQLVLALNNTKVSVRDNENNFRVIYNGDGSTLIRQSSRANESFTTEELPNLYAHGEIQLPTIANIGENNGIVAGWSEERLNDISNIIVVYSSDGVDFEDPIDITSENKNSVGLSLYGFLQTDGKPGAVAAWVQREVDRDSGKVVVKKWNGEKWNADDWIRTILNPSSGLGADVSVSGYGESIVVAWEDGIDSQKRIYFARSDDGGDSWNTENMINVDQPDRAEDALLPEGDPSVCLAGNNTVYVSYQLSNKKILLVRSLDGGPFDLVAQFESGYFPHLSCNSNGVIAVAWEYFKPEDDSKDNNIKQFGLALSMDSAQTFDSPFAMPDSSTKFGILQPSVSISNDFLDTFWIEYANKEEGGGQILYNRIARLRQ